MATLHAIKYHEEFFGFSFPAATYQVVGLEKFDRPVLATPSLVFVCVEDLTAHPEKSTDIDFRRVARTMGLAYAQYSQLQHATEESSFYYNALARLQETFFMSFIFDPVLERVRLAADVVVPETSYRLSKKGSPLNTKVPTCPVPWARGLEWHSTFCLVTCPAEESNTSSDQDGSRERKLAWQSLLNLIAQKADQTETKILSSKLLEENLEFAGAFKVWRSSEQWKTIGTLEVVLMRIKWTHSVEDVVIEWKLENYHPSDQMSIIPVAINFLHRETAENLFEKDRIIVLEGTGGSYTLKGIPSNNILLFHRNYCPEGIFVFPFLNTMDLCLVAKSEKDNYLRWEAMQSLWAQWAISIVSPRLVSLAAAEVLEIKSLFLSAINDFKAPGLSARVLTPPSSLTICLMYPPQDPVNVFNALRTIQYEIARDYRSEISQALDFWSDRGRQIEINASAMFRRQKKNALLSLLSYLINEDPSLPRLFMNHFDRAYIWGDRKRVAELMLEQNFESETYLAQAQKYCTAFDVVCSSSWLEIAACVCRENGVSWLQNLLKSQEDSGKFAWNSVNRRLFLNSFVRNPALFHQSDGAGYQFLSEQILQLDANESPATACQFLHRFNCGTLFSFERRHLMLSTIETTIAGNKHASKELKSAVEVVGCSLRY
eukprot:Gregarina_sp_Poly_1__11254@NODE_92_length_14764_cov_231_259032_g79_i0_p3_GENE_NODE_92_length_14764_cov_231_259032_g79_i0NODE_92_length_14764_cov_231_259032_g79_i0_p3_ORF_typecomplete_len659_score91_30DUF3458_C/PF17432_2/8_8e33Peptidase_M1/PF01433_20/0_00051DUF3458/PF11940_8/0_37_NODE_92_length_14764_cov_231_259032_g79_i058117787